jgi:hypothetical protein
LNLGMMSKVIRECPRDAEGWMHITSYNLDELVAKAR